MSETVTRGRKEVLGTPLHESPMHFGAKSIGEVPNGAAIKLRKYINGNIDRIKVKVWMVILIYKLSLCEEILSLLPEHFMEKYPMP